MLGMTGSKWRRVLVWFLMPVLLRSVMVMLKRLQDKYGWNSGWSVLS